MSSGLPVALRCPSCGGPFSSRILETGSERCTFCDVVSRSAADGRRAEPEKELNRLDRSLGTARRFGTVVLAPLLGVSVVVVLNFGRHFRNTEGGIELSVFVGACIVALLGLRRRILAAVWTLFFTIALLNERAVAFFSVAPDARFSFTSEVSLIPFVAAVATVAVFALLFWGSHGVAHEQQKLSWRTAVALPFVLGLGAGIVFFSRPYTGEVHRAWGWEHSRESARLMRLQPELEEFTGGVKEALAIEPGIRWIRRQPAQINVVFMPYAALDQLPDLELYRLTPEQRGSLVGHYAWNLEKAREAAAARAWFSPERAEEGWRGEVEGPVTAPWVVIYDIGPMSARYWLARRLRESHFDVGPAPSTLELVAYQSSEVSAGREVASGAEPSDWILESLRGLTGGEFVETD